MSVSYSLFIIIISIFSLGILAGDLFFISDPSIVSVIQQIDVVICGLFFLDFLYTLYMAENRLKYLYTWGWIDLISCIPMVDQLRTGRLIRIYRLVRLLRAIKATKILINFILKNRANNAFLAVVLLTLLMVSMGSIMILIFENVPEANIKNAEDAIWWSYVTITTVGYGDRFPVTTEGRILGALLMTVGVGIFGIFSGFVASWFLKPEQDIIEIDIEDVHTEVKRLTEIVEKLSVELEKRNGVQQNEAIPQNDGDDNLRPTSSGDDTQNTMVVCS